jgi:hypothetical protein
MKRMLEHGLHCGCPDLDQCIDCVLKIHCDAISSGDGIEKDL